SPGGNACCWRCSWRPKRTTRLSCGKATCAPDLASDLSAARLRPLTTGEAAAASAAAAALAKDLESKSGLRSSSPARFPSSPFACCADSGSTCGTCFERAVAADLAADNAVAAEGAASSVPRESECG